jgi:hypothetical protein
MSDLTLEQRLVTMGEGLTFPGQATLADDVVAALGAAPDVSRWRRPLVAAAAILLLVAVILGAVPSTRHAVARWLGLEGLPIRVGVHLPVAGDVDLGPSMTLAEASARAGVVPYVAPGLGAPLDVYSPGGGYVVVRYDDRGTQVLVTTLPGTVDDRGFSKLVSSGAQVREVTVEGHDGWWTTGEPHLFLYEDRLTRLREARPSADSLVWQVGDTIVRIEADVPLARAMALAAEVRPVEPD